MDLSILRQAALGIVPPLAVGSLVWFPLWRPWLRGPRQGGAAAPPGPGEEPGPGRTCGTPLVFGAGYALAHLGLHGWGLAGNLDVKERLFWSALVSAVLGCTLVLVRLPRIPTALLRLVTCAGFVLFLLAFKLRSAWGASEAALAALGFGAALALLWTLGERASRGHEGPARPLALTIGAGAVAGALTLTGSASLGQLAGSVSAAAGLATVLAWRVPSFSLRGAHGPVAVLLGGALLAGHYTSSLGAPTAALLALGLLAPPLLPGSGRRRAAWAILTALLLSGLALGHAWASLPDDPYAGY